MTAAIRKLPLSFTRLAAFGVSETMKVFCLIASRRGARGFDRVVLTCGNDKELARSREVGASEQSFTPA
jgi:hypothetical protein